MSVTPTAGDTGATDSADTAGTAAAPKAPAKKTATKRTATKRTETKAATETAEAFKPLKMTRARDKQERTAYSLEDQVKYEYEGFGSSSK